MLQFASSTREPDDNWTHSYALLSLFTERRLYTVFFIFIDIENPILKIFLQIFSPEPNISADQGAFLLVQG